MSDFSEADHPRGTAGRFSDKDNSAPEVALGSARTTLSEYAGKRARNYSRMPTIDVPIIENPERHCRSCGEPATHKPAGEGQILGGWEHTETQDQEHYVSARTVCVYCGTDDPDEVAFHQRNWSDETECARCGGVSGYAIGD